MAGQAGDRITLGPGLTLHHPAAGAQPARSRPTLLVLCAWMNAAEKHIEVYRQEYARRLPGAAQLVVRAETGDFFVPQATHARKLAPAVACILAHARGGKAGAAATDDEDDNENELGAVPAPASSSSSSSPLLLLHAFSNGGSVMAVQLALSLRAESPPTGPVRFARVIVDCAPSRPHIGAGARAMTAGLPGTLGFRLLAEALTRVFLTFMKIYQLLLRRENRLHVLCRRMNQPGLLLAPPPSPQPSSSLTGSKDSAEMSPQRLYLYSLADRMVPWKDVADHAREARERAGGAGAVQEVVFAKAAHCALPREDYEKYWGAIEGFFALAR